MRFDFLTSSVSGIYLRGKMIFSTDFKYKCLLFGLLHFKLYLIIIVTLFFRDLIQ